MSNLSLKDKFHFLIRHPRHTLHQLEKRIAYRRRHNWIQQYAHKIDIKIPPPLAYGIEVTSCCNLRCPMCYAWGEKGWYRKKSEAGISVEQELDWDLARRIVIETQADNPFYTLWGGEPLLYSRLRDFLALTRRMRRFCYICTNGLLLDQYIKDIGQNPYVTMIVSIDGLEREHDQVRGEGTFRKTIKNIQQLKMECLHPPHIGVELTVLPHNVPVLADFCIAMVKLGFDWILLNLRWFITPAQAQNYESMMQQSLGVVPEAHKSYCSENYSIDRVVFAREFEKVQKLRLRSPVRWSPPITNADQINRYIEFPELPLSQPFCNKQWMQMDIDCRGRVVTCKDWPDYVVGDLHDQSLDELWNCSRYQGFRRVILQQLFPICSKCYALPLYRDRRTDKKPS